MFLIYLIYVFVEGGVLCYCYLDIYILKNIFFALLGWLDFDSLVEIAFVQENKVLFIYLFFRFVSGAYGVREIILSLGQLATTFM